jgi:16S rRNA (adenine1518-N6/adenine1519-N6)-dimethyltransferase
MKKLGQHFLKNKSVLDTIVKALELEKNDRVIEIGPGHGELTIPLLYASGKLGGAVISIEKDHSLIAELAALQEKERDGGFEIIEGDALKLLPEIVAKVSGKNKNPAAYKIVGNIPYYITGKLLRVISELENKPRTTVLMIQKEVAERICAVAPEMNRLAASVQFWADAKIIAAVPKKDFAPSPEVDSAVILLKTKKNGGSNDQEINAEQYYKTVRGVFAQPRKNLINNIFEMAGKETPKATIIESLKKIGIDPESRPQNLSIEQITAIAQVFC